MKRSIFRPPRCLSPTRERICSISPESLQIVVRLEVRQARVVDDSSVRQIPVLYDSILNCNSPFRSLSPSSRWWRAVCTVCDCRCDMWLQIQSIPQYRPRPKRIDGRVQRAGHSDRRLLGNGRASQRCSIWSDSRSLLRSKRKYRTSKVGGRSPALHRPHLIKALGVIRPACKASSIARLIEWGKKHAVVGH